MRLSLHTDYALRTLMYLGGVEAQASVDRVANAYGVSRNHLMKVANRLAELGYVEAKRGRGGGLALARPPEDINVGAVVRALETTSGFVECFDPETNACPIAGLCGLQGALSTALGDFLARLDRYTLADIIPGKAGFRTRLLAQVA
jgi:Rrf2 family transcriptional regulator, nitric oxide-sensitive transcriptional repressor